jgi:acyl-coenzyme A thioesterase PaaI-like protein
MLNSSAVTPTMDLRLDYMHPAKPFEPIYVAAKVYKNTSNVIFCRGSAWQDDRDNPIAHCVANFMRVETSSVTVGAIIKRRVGRLFNRKNQTK